MGWWSETILGGDTPLDFLPDLEGALDVKELYPVRGWTNEVREAVQKAFAWNWKPILRMIEAEWGEGDYNNIAIQVTAVIAMAAGAEFPEGFEEKAIKAADQDEWANEDDGPRRRVMTDFKKMLETYESGTPSEAEEKGLFEKIAEVLG